MHSALKPLLKFNAKQLSFFAMENQPLFSNAFTRLRKKLNAPLSQAIGTIAQSYLGWRPEQHRDLFNVLKTGIDDTEKLLDINNDQGNISIPALAHLYDFLFAALRLNDTILSAAKMTLLKEWDGAFDAAEKFFSEEINPYIRRWNDLVAELEGDGRLAKEKDTWRINKESSSIIVSDPTEISLLNAIFEIPNQSMQSRIEYAKEIILEMEERSEFMKRCLPLLRKEMHMLTSLVVSPANAIAGPVGDAKLLSSPPPPSIPDH